MTGLDFPLRRMQGLGMGNAARANRTRVLRACVAKVLSGDVDFPFAIAAKLAHVSQTDFVSDLREIGTCGKEGAIA